MYELVSLLAMLEDNISTGHVSSVVNSGDIKVHNLTVIHGYFAKNMNKVNPVM